MSRNALTRAAISRQVRLGNSGLGLFSSSLSRIRIRPCLGRQSFHDVGRRVSAFDAVSGFKPSSTHSLPNLSHENETIYALSSGSGKAGIAVIRISGPGCLDVYNGLCPSKPPPKARYAGVRTLTEPGQLANIVDSDALVLYFPGPKTVTGEDVLELHVHGGSATVKAVLSAIPKCALSPPSMMQTRSIRYAEPGEFTRRAFLNRRLDLAQVESLSDTLAAETEQQRRAAVRGNSGILGRTYESWREQLLLARGEIEALIDFSEDQHFDESPAELLANVTRQVAEILGSIAVHEAAGQRSELLRNGIRIALLGPPNVGKSSLMNQIVGREASIVSAEAGTTRDIVEASLDIRGYLCSFADTAGIRTQSSSLQLPPPPPSSASSPQSSFPPKQSQSQPSSGEQQQQQQHPVEFADPELFPPSSPPIGAVEQEGIRRARKKALDSDVVIVLASVEPTQAATALTGSDKDFGQSGHGHDDYYLHYDLSTLDLAAAAQQCLVVINKSDAVSPRVLNKLVDHFCTSVLSKVENLMDHVAEQPPLTISCRVASSEAVAGKSHVAAAGAGVSASAVGLTRLTKRRDGDDTGTGGGGSGIQTLTDRLVQSFANLTSLPGDMQHLLGVTERQNQLLVQCRRHLEAFMDEAEAGGDDVDIVIAAENLRLAADRLAAITGRGEGGDVEEVLGVIFEKFCVGK
ncbi:hypothetical protein B0T17DRAFT_503682 [Bombardia bombarda]|uniref:Uncharacterized protein n=1 Tax=Bombardia bombarda TaxID=252184 RepID=A0AA39XM98_9PEZI|nr:hypothetical protein B0T17DRAFT_503682 [Bombardia bombarda]